MPSPDPDLHGNVPDKSDVALLLIDVLNDLEFDGGDAILEHAIPMANALRTLKRRARQAGVPVVYVNDNFGKWRSDFRQQLDHCLNDDVRGRPVVERLVPDEEDYFVLKPKHSGFYHTTLPLLLEYLEVSKLIVTGIATDNCVLYTAADAYMSDLEVYVPPDCCAAEHTRRHEAALEQMKKTLKADTTPSPELDLGILSGVARRGVEQSLR
jgi:nicotinamidase-related amidase